MLNHYKILRRKLAMESQMIPSDQKNLYSLLKESVRKNSPDIGFRIDNCIKESSNKYNANKYYKTLIQIMESLDGSLLDHSTIEFSKEIIPYIDDLTSLKFDILESNIEESSKNHILQSIKENKIADRVLNNNKEIQKRFDMDKVISESRYRSLEDIVFGYCSLIDTYNSPSYGKMNIALEQLSYSLQKEAIEYDNKDLVSLVTEYFLLTNSNITSKDKKGYKKVLTENQFISEGDTQKVQYVLNEELLANSDNVEDLLKDFKANEKKNEGTLKSTISKIYTKSPASIIDETPSILSFLRNLFILGTFSIHPILGILVFITDKTISLTLKRKQIDKVIKAFNNEAKKVENKMEKVDGDKYDDLSKYSDQLNKCIDKLEEYRGTLFSDEKLTDDEDFNLKTESAHIYSLHEFRIFKFHNLLNAVMHIDKFLARKNNKIKMSIDKKAKKIFDVSKKFFTESVEEDMLIKNITDENMFDCCLSIYKANNDDDMVELHDLFGELCKTINNSVFDCRESYRITYEAYDNLFELHLQDASYIDLNKDELALKENVVSDRDAFTMDEVISTTEYISKLTNTIDIENIVSDMISCAENKKLNKDLLDALSYSHLISNRDLNNIIECALENTDNYVSKNAISQLKYEIQTNRYLAPAEIELEALELVASSMNEAVNLNSVKLAMEGIKKKIKELGSKEQEMCRDLDSTVNHFAKSAEDAMTSNRREAIIKGSVIPSFSKAVKIGIGLAGIGLVVDPIAAVITAFVGLAISKNLTRKERNLMLDEIDIELKAVEKEISMAEDGKNMKKYRKLLTYQKKLQRERARIKYNIKTGGSLPDTHEN